MGLRNTAFGADALTNTTTGDDNTGYGANTLRENTIGQDNTAVGSSALRFNTGNGNTAVGQGALDFNTSGSSNTAVGQSVLLGNSTSSDNSAIGSQALMSGSGGRNTAIGSKALKKSLGTKNIGIGYQAGVTLTIGNNNILIGNQGVGDESQTIRIGTAQTGTFIAGIANATVGNAATVIIDTTTGQLGIPLSSARYKQDIEAMANRSEGLLKLRPVTFVYKDDASAAPRRFGLIAEEVAAVYPELVTRTASGEVQTVKYYELIPMLLNELQHEHQALEREHQARQEDRAEMASLRKELAEFRSLVGSHLSQ